MIGIVLVVLAIAVYTSVLLVGWRRKAWGGLGVTLYGPVMMLRTKRGRGFIDRVSSRRRLWTAYGRVSVLFTLIAMVGLTLFLLLQAYKTTSEPVAVVSPLGSDIKLPGTNILSTLAYVIFAFAVATAAHEFMHGIMSTAESIKLDSMGLLLLVIPIGAFVEPDDSELKKTRPSRRARIFSAGPATNLTIALFAIVMLVVVLGPYSKQTTEGALVASVDPNSPAEKFGLRIWSEITAVDGVAIRSPADAERLQYSEPGELLEVNYIFHSRPGLAIIPSGVVIGEVWDGPAFNAGIKPGMIIKSLNDTTINSQDELTSVTENSTHEEPVNITVLKYGYDTLRGQYWFVEDAAIKTVNLTSKWTYYFAHNLAGNKEEFRNQSVLGVVLHPFGAGLKDPEFLLDAFARPYKDVRTPMDAIDATERYLSLPFSGYAPVAAEATGLYTPAGNLNGIPHDLYWVSMNALYWIFWVNLLLGVTNSLPALPMDGGYLLKDGVRELFRRIGLRLTGLDRMIGMTGPTNLQADILVYLVSAPVYGIAVFLLVWRIVWSPA